MADNKNFHMLSNSQLVSFPFYAFDQSQSKTDDDINATGFDSMPKSGKVAQRKAIAFYFKLFV